MNEILLGIDPGKRTGICWIAVNEDNISLEGYEEIQNGLKGFLVWLSNLSAENVDLIVCESFSTREGTHGVDTTPLEVIGSLSFFANTNGVRLEMRPPSGRIRQVPDLIMKKLGFYLPGKKNRNCREAIRHVLCHLKAQKNLVVLDAF